MKRILITLSLLAFGLFSYAQDDSKTINIKAKFTGLDLGFSNLVNVDEANTLKPLKSLYWGFNIGSLYLPLDGEKFGLELGIGAYVHSRTFNNETSPFPNEDVKSYKKMKYKNIGASIPLLLTKNFFLENDNKVFIQGGVLGKYHIHNTYKEKYELQNGDKAKTKYHESFGVQPFVADLYLKLGTQNWAIFGSYNLSDYFRNSDARMVTIGVSFGVE